MQDNVVICFLIWLSTFHGNRAQVNETEIPSKQCRTPQGVLGECISIRECDPIIRLLQSRDSDQNLSYVKESGCGYNRYDPLVCCPISQLPLNQPNPTAQMSSALVDDGVELLDGNLGQCGNITSSLPPHDPNAVVGGFVAIYHDWPWIVALGYRKPEANATNFLCGGVLISKRHVLTAAHCVAHRSDLYLARLGEFDFENDTDDAVDILISRAIPHEDYNRKTRVADIAMIYLKEEAQYSIAIYPICLPFPDNVVNESFTSMYINEYPRGAGWGATEYQGPGSSKLQVALLPIVLNEECKEDYKAFPNQIIDDRILCAGYKKGGIDACSGDSGGPLIWTKNNAYEPYSIEYLIGIVSYGYRCAEPGFPGVYTRVTAFLPWIIDKLREQ